MKVLSIIDSFKGTLTSNELGNSMTKVLTNKKIEADYIPISDGGDGFLDVIEKVTKTSRIKVNVLNPLRNPIETYYLYDYKSNVAYIELAKSSGINLLRKEELNPYLTSTYGLGETINYAIACGVKKIIIGIGGSATNDGGAGMLEAMGCLFYDQDNNLLKDLAGGIIDQVHRMDVSFFSEKIKGVEFLVLSDVKNPLLHEEGATFVFSKQKGASEEDINILDRKMQKYATTFENELNKNYSKCMGSGAAGGVGFAFRALFKAEFYQGIDYILDLVDFDNLIKKYDYIITGEGKIDEQSLDGKVVFGISQRAQRKKIILVCAINEIDENYLEGKNIYKIYSIVNNVATMEESMNNPMDCYLKLCETISF